MDIFLNRVTKGGLGTYGVLVKDQIPLCVTLELPWLQNRHDVSCIPDGVYPVTRQGEYYAVDCVPDRFSIRIHTGNFLRDTKGCILVGSSFTPTGIADSIRAMSKLHVMLPMSFNLIVRSV